MSINANYEPINSSKFTPPFKTTFCENDGSYDTFLKVLGVQDREIIEFGQGKKGISKNSELLYSTSFAMCTGLILHNNQTNQAALFHLHYGGYSPGFNRMIEEFILDPSNKDTSTITAQFLKGNKCYEVYDYTDTIKELGFKLNPDIVFDQKEAHWAVIYNPKEKTAYVYPRNVEKILEYKI